jgi:hypothetical protein
MSRFGLPTGRKKGRSADYRLSTRRDGKEQPAAKTGNPTKSVERFHFLVREKALDVLRGGGKQPLGLFGWYPVAKQLLESRRVDYRRLTEGYIIALAVQTVLRDEWARVLAIEKGSGRRKNEIPERLRYDKLRVNLTLFYGEFREASLALRSKN